MVFVDQRRRHVGAVAPLAPGHVLARGRPVAERNVASRRRSHGQDRRGEAVGVGEIDQLVGDDRRGHRNVPAAGHPPDLAAGLELVAADVPVAVDRQQQCSPMSVDGGGGPGRHLLPGRPPELATVAGVEGGEKVLPLDVALHDHLAGVEDRRAAEAPLGGGGDVEAGVQHTQVFAPQQLAVEIETVEPFRAEERHQMPTVRRGSRIGVTRLRVSLDARDSLVRRPLPDDRSVRLVDAEDLPAKGLLLVDRIDVAVEAHPQGLLSGLADGRGHVQPAAPNDGAGMAQSGYRPPPADALAAFGVPALRRSEASRHAAGAGPAKRRPVDAGLGLAGDRSRDNR